MEAIFDKIGVNKALVYLNFISDRRNPDQPLLQTFLNKLINEGIFTQKTLDGMIEEELKKPSVSMANVETVMSCSSLNRRDSEFTNMNLLKEYKSTTEVFDYNAKENNEIKINNALKAANGNQELLWKGFCNYSYKTESIENDKLEKDSKPISELIVSSYSVNSNYLNDSETEDALESEKDLLQSHLENEKIMEKLNEGKSN